MKSFFLAGWIILCCAFSGFSANNDIKAPVTGVTIYQNGAQVERTAAVTLTAGTQTLYLRGVTPLLKKESIRVSAPGTVTIVSVNYEQKTDYQDVPVESIEVLNKRIRAIDLEMEELKSALDVLNAEESIIITLRNPTALKKETTIDDIIKAQTVLRDKMAIIRAGQTDNIRRQEALTAERNRIQQEITSLNQPRSSFSNAIRIVLKSEGASTETLKIQYYVNGASWFPQYDIRVKDINSPLMINYNAVISQQTGEDWNDVQIRLATSNPELTGNKPQLKPWYVNQGTPYQQQQSNQTRYTGTTNPVLTGRVTDEYGEPLPYAAVMVVNTTVGTYTDIEGNFSLTLPADARQIHVKFIGYDDAVMNISGQRMDVVLKENVALMEVMVVEYSTPSIKTNETGSVTLSEVRPQRSMSRSMNSMASTSRVKKYNATASVQMAAPEYVVDAEFEIREKYSIPSDAMQYHVSIRQISTGATYQYYCAPRLDKDVFLTALITDWEQYNLLEGNTHIYFEGTYIGSGLMNTRFIKDTIDISLGRDRMVQVERNKVKDQSKVKTFEKEVTASVKWEILVRNNKPFPINMIIDDQVPLSSNEKVTVKQEFGQGARLDEKTGYLSWKLDLAPTTAKTLDFKYTVSYPAGWNMALE